MTVVAARHGYAATSVARVVEQAGMSRATFYEHFEDRDDCFLAAFRAAAEPVREGLVASDGLCGQEWPRMALERVLVLAARNPVPTSLLMIEALAAGPSARAEYEQLLDEVEARVAVALDAAEELLSIELPARALVGGIGHLVGARAFRREASDLATLRGDLLAWLASYALPPARRRMSAEDWLRLGRAGEEGRETPPPAPRSGRALPRGRSALPPGQVASAHRERIVEAIAACVRAQGYAGTTVADLVAVAGITRAAFYEQFRNKEDAFLAAQALGLERSAALAAARFFTDAPWPERVWNSAEALVGYIADHVDLAHASAIEAYAAGPAAVRRAIDSRMAYTLFLEDGYRQRPQAEMLPRLAGEAISGGIGELLRRQVVLGRTERARELVPQVAYVALAPFIGAEAALDFVIERCRRPA